MLVAVAARLTAAIRPGDTAARLGGDEFAVLLPGVGQVFAQRVADRITSQVTVPLDIEADTLAVHASIGIAVGTPDDLEALLRTADLSMYAAKNTHVTPDDSAPRRVPPE